MQYYGNGMRNAMVNGLLIIKTQTQADPQQGIPEGETQQGRD